MEMINQQAPFARSGKMSHEASEGVIVVAARQKDLPYKTILSSLTTSHRKRGWFCRGDSPNRSGISHQLAGSILIVVGSSDKTQAARRPPAEMPTIPFLRITNNR